MACARMLPLSLLIVFLGTLSPSLAQEPPAAPPVDADVYTAPAEEAPAHITLVDGEASIVREGRSTEAAANVPLLSGDRVQTAEGRLEVLFADGSILDIDRQTTLDLLSEGLIRLLGGQLILTTARGQNEDGGLARAYQVDAATGSVRVRAPGEYRVATAQGLNQDPELDVIVRRGLAELVTDAGSVRVSAGERSIAREGISPTFPQPANSARWDAFDQWAEARRDARTGRASASYLPRELQTYAGTFDRGGSWSQTSPYGYVWYPQVAPGWRPYFDGSWMPTSAFGWTWVGGAPWAWPTHHFGRWGLSRSGAWFWIPGRVWAPAWVSWAVSPGFVSWCPLGFDNRPVIGFSFFSGTSFGSFGRTFDRWSAWTVIPTNRWGTRARVPRVAVDARTLPTTAVRRFTVRATPPGSLAGEGARLRARGPSPSPRAAVVGRAIPRGAVGTAVTRPAMPRGWTASVPQTGSAPTPARRGTPEGAAAAMRQMERRRGMDTSTGSTIGAGQALPRMVPPTRIEQPAAPPVVPSSPYPRARRPYDLPVQSPYDQAARAARERTPRGAGAIESPAHRAEPVSPYPPTFRTPVPEPFRARPSGGGEHLGRPGHPASPMGRSGPVTPAPGASPLPHQPPSAPTRVAPPRPAPQPSAAPPRHAQPRPHGGAAVRRER